MSPCCFSAFLVRRVDSYSLLFTGDKTSICFKRVLQPSSFLSIRSEHSVKKGIISEQIPHTSVYLFAEQRKYVHVQLRISVRTV
jgi:hypothetical protein